MNQKTEVGLLLLGMEFFAFLMFFLVLGIEWTAELVAVVGTIAVFGIFNLTALGLIIAGVFSKD